MHGKTFTVSTYSIPPFMYIDDNDVVHDGIAIRYVNTLAEHYKFNYISTFPGLYFQFYANGTVGGSMGEVRIVWLRYCKCIYNVDSHLGYERRRRF